MQKPGCAVIAIEEHYWDPELIRHYTGLEAPKGADIETRLHDLGSLRLKEMDGAGIDVQVLSHGAPSTQKLPAEIAVKLTAEVNDRLAAARAANPERASPPSPPCRPRSRKRPPTSSSAASTSMASRAP
jgi:2,3-dihydroxybenzoate decarboxylase